MKTKLAGIARGFFELPHRPTNASGQLRQFLAPEEQENDDQHKEDEPLAYNGIQRFGSYLLNRFGRLFEFHAVPLPEGAAPRIGPE